MTALHWAPRLPFITRGDLISFRIVHLLLICLLMTGCAVRPFVLNQTADALAGQGAADEEDVQLAREASAFYLKASESVLRETPGHMKLAEAVAGGFTQYAYAFVALEAEKIDAQQPKLAARMRERAARLYARAHVHAMTALETNRPGFSAALRANNQHSKPPLTSQDVPLLYWAAASLGGKISMSKDDADVVADLPLSIRLADWAWQIDPRFGRGALASLMGTLESAKVAGSRVKAERYFDQAIEWGQGQEAGPWVAKAEGLALPNQDRKQFEEWLQQALKISQQHRSLQNEVMRERAQWLLLSSDDLF